MLFLKFTSINEIFNKKNRLNSNLRPFKVLSEGKEGKEGKYKRFLFGVDGEFLFNAKIKSFRSQFRGVKDKAFFLFRLAKIYA